MSAVVSAQQAMTPAERLRDAGWVAFVGLVLGIPLIGLTTVDVGGRLAVRGNWDEGLPFVEAAIGRMIGPPGWYYVPIAVHLLLEGRYAEMLPYAEKSAGEAPGAALVAIAQGALGNKEAAGEALAAMARLSPAYGRDPAAFLRRFQAVDSIVDAQVKGLRNAGWAPPD